MKKCSQCKEKIHSSSNICSYCGAEQKKRFDEKIIAIILVAILGAGFLIYLFNKPIDKEDQQKKAKSRELAVLQIKAENTVKAMMKDPDSVKFSNQIGPCGFYNAKNSFGAYTGFKRYVVFEEMSALEDVNVSSEDMNQLWKTACKY